MGNDIVVSATQSFFVLNNPTEYTQTCKCDSESVYTVEFDLICVKKGGYNTHCRKIPPLIDNEGF